jgi:proline dehydrogenase
MMIGLARSESLRDFMQGSRLMNRFSRQFVGGADAHEAAKRARELSEQGITSSLFVLGEYESDAEQVEARAEELVFVLPLLAERDLDLHVSVDPTQIGSLVSWDLCRKNAARLGRAVAGTGSGKRKVLMLDMEDSSVTQSTLDLYRGLKGQGLPAAMTTTRSSSRPAWLGREDGERRPGRWRCSWAFGPPTSSPW